MQEDSLCESETYKVSKITLAPNSEYTIHQNIDAIHITILEGTCLVNINGDEFDDAEIGEVIHIHPQESFHIKNKDPLINCILLKVQIYTQSEKRGERKEMEVETQIDFSTISLRSFRLIGYTDSDLDTNTNTENDEFKCKYC